MDKFEGPGFKNDDDFFNIATKKHTNRPYLLPNLDFFFFKQNFPVWLIRKW